MLQMIHSVISRVYKSEINLSGAMDVIIIDLEDDEGAAL